MKYIFLLFFALVIAATARAGQPWIFGSGEAVNLTNGTAFQNGVKNIAGALDPSAVAVNAPSGSMYFSTSGTIYVKQDAGLTTNWLPLGIATTGSLTTINGQSGPNVNIAAGSSGSDFNIAASSNTITLNIPSASGSNRGLLTSADYAAFLAKQDAITGAASTVVSSNLTANRAVISNGSGKIAASAVTDTELGYVGGVTSAIQTQLDGKEPTIASGTTSQFWRGDKTFVALAKGDVGLGNVDNTSDANKPVSTATQTALDLKVDGAASSVDSEVMLYSGTTGKTSKRATGSGYAKLTSGVLSASANVPAADLSGQVALANGGTNKNMTAVNGGVVYTDSDSQEVTSAGISGQVLKSNGAAAPTWETKNLPMKGNASLVQNVQRLIVPNKQLTLVTGSDYFAETGNKNILEDASFEGANAAPSWTLTAGSFVSDNSPIDGSLNAELSLSSQSLYFSQDSTLYASQFADGVQGLAMIRARTAVTSAPIYVCPTQAGSVPSSLTSGCVQIQANNKWGLYKIPFILGATSNGIAITSNSVAISGSVELDDAFVGAVDLKQDVDQSRIAGESYFAGTTNCLWSRTSTTVGAFTADSDCVGPTVADSSMGSWQTTDTDLPRQIINNLPNGKYRATFYFPNSNGSSGQFSAFAINDGTSTCEPVSGGSNTTLDGSSVSCVFNYSTTGNRIFEIYAAAASGSININNGSTTPRASVKFILEYFGNSQIYSSTCGANCVDTFSAKVSSAGVVSGENIDWINGNFSIASTSVFTASYNSNIFTVEPNCTITTDQASGGGHVTKRAASSSSVLEYATYNSADTTTAHAVEIICQKQGVDFVATRIIQGTFNEVMTTPGVTKPKTCYYSFGGSGSATSPTACTGTCVEYYDSCNAVSSVPVRTGAGVYTLSFANGTFANSTFVKCSGFGVHKIQPAFTNAVTGSTSSGGVDLGVYAISNGGGTQTATDSYPNIECEGQAP